MNMAILHAFLSDQRRAEMEVARHFAAPQDMLAMDWARHSAQFRKQFDQQPFADVFCPHGYGLELRIADFYIDYDYSTEGRPDGFDAWRLFVWLTSGQYDNSGADRHLRDRLFDWVDELYANGRLIRPDNLYYLTEASAKAQ